MVYTFLRDTGNQYPHLQQRVLKRFIEKQSQKLKELSSTEDQMDAILLETHCELLAALRELSESVTSPAEKLSYL